MTTVLLPFLLCVSLAQEPAKVAPPVAQKPAQVAQEASANVYDVTDILRPGPSGPAVSTMVLAGKHPVITAAGETHEAPAPVPDAEAVAEKAQQEQQRLLASTRALSDQIRPLMTPPLQGTELLQAAGPGQMVLFASPDKHAWLSAFLKRNRPQEQLLFVQTQWIEGPKGAFERMGIAAGASATVLEAKERERFLALGKDDARFTVLNAPRLLTSPLIASGCIYVGETVSYVKGYKLVVVQPGDVKIADPEIGTVDVGFQLIARGALLEDSKVALEIDASNSAVREPIPTRTVKLAPEITQELTVAVPEIFKKSIHAQCTLSGDGLLAFCSPVAGHDEREFLILVSARAQSAAGLKAGPAETTVTAGKKKPAEKPK
jgi:hypothetical protein